MTINLLCLWAKLFFCFSSTSSSPSCTHIYLASRCVDFSFSVCVCFSYVNGSLCNCCSVHHFYHCLFIIISPFLLVIVVYIRHICNKRREHFFGRRLSEVNVIYTHTHSHRKHQREREKRTTKQISTITTTTAVKNDKKQRENTRFANVAAQEATTATKSYT